MTTINTKIFFTSDWHLFHTNVIKFDNRPFKDIDHMHRVLINNYNSCVKEKDVCYFLGDIGMGNSEGIKNIINKLNGTKICIVGNHDKGYQALYGMGFNVVLHNATIYLGRNKITMSHCPLLGVKREDTSQMRNCTGEENWHGEHKNEKYSVKDEGQLHLHGHIHSPNGGKSSKILDRQMDVGVAANNYFPVSISQIESWITTTLQK